MNFQYLYLAGFLVNLGVLFWGIIKGYFFVKKEIALLKNDISHLRSDISDIKRRLERLENHLWTER